jgi:hypothetical protein
MDAWLGLGSLKQSLRQGLECQLINFGGYPNKRERDGVKRLRQKMQINGVSLKLLL